MNKICILLTACVNPGGMVFTALQDSEERKRQYENALNFYLRETNVPIVLVENSGYDFSKQYSEYIKAGRLECHSYLGNDYDKSLGKGYGEANIILYAAEHSNLYKESQYIIKITGRLIIKNIKDIINSHCLELENVVLLDFQPNVNILTTCFVLQPQLLAEICREGLPKLNDTEGIYFEHVIYSGLCKRKCNIIPFENTPIIDGICGSSLQPYSEGLNADKTPINIEYLARYYQEIKRYADAQIIKIFQNYLTTQITHLNEQIKDRQNYIYEIEDRETQKQKYIEEIENRENQKQKYIEECEYQIKALKPQIDSLKHLSQIRLKIIKLLIFSFAVIFVTLAIFNLSLL